MPGIGTLSLTARFARAPVHHQQTPRASPNPITIGLQSVGAVANGQYLIGTVTGTVDVRMPGCVHKRTYSSPARGELTGSKLLRGRRQNSLGVSFAPTKDLAANWAPTCPNWRRENRSLADVMRALGNQRERLSSPGAEGMLYVAQVGGFRIPGKASLSAEYGYSTLGAEGAEAPLRWPWRELWAGKSVTLRQGLVLEAFPGRRPWVWEVRLRLTRR
jgi:hypothetical protein